MMPEFWSGLCPVRTKPSQAGLGVETGAVIDFHHVAVFELGSQGGLLAVHMRAATVSVADIAVNGVSKIHHRGATRQGHESGSWA
jgi:hypothetical protein